MHKVQFNSRNKKIFPTDFGWDNVFLCNLEISKLLTIPSQKVSNIREWVFVIQFLCTSLSFVFWNFSFAAATSTSTWGRLSFRACHIDTPPSPTFSSCCRGRWGQISCSTPGTRPPPHRTRAWLSHKLESLKCKFMAINLWLYQTLQNSKSKIYLI